MRRFLTFVVLIVAALAAGFAYFYPSWMGTVGEPPYRLVTVDRGNIVATVNAAGTIAPITTAIV